MWGRNIGTLSWTRRWLGVAPFRNSLAPDLPWQIASPLVHPSIRRNTMNKMSFACVCIFAGSLCLTASAQSDKAKAPSGTVVDKKHADGSTEVQPEFKK